MSSNTCRSSRPETCRHAMEEQLCGWEEPGKNVVLNGLPNGGHEHASHDVFREGKKNGFGIVGLNHTRDGKAEGLSGGAKNIDCNGVSGRREFFQILQVLDFERAVARQLNHGSHAADGIQAALLSAGTGKPVQIHGEMPNFSSAAAFSAIQPSRYIVACTDGVDQCHDAEVG